MASEPTLADVLADAWRRLEDAVRDRRSALHNPTLVTLGLDGAPRARTVVLRAVEASRGELRVHTDIRSAKVEELARDGRASLHVYDAEARLQLRLKGRAVVERDGPAADAAWAEAQPMSRLTYRVEPGPGAVIPAAHAYDGGAEASDGESRGRWNFAVVIVTAESLETLSLAHDGHVRARFDLESGKGAWLTP